MSTIERYISLKIRTYAITIAGYKSVRYIEVFLYEFECDSAGFTACPLLTNLAVFRLKA